MVQSSAGDAVRRVLIEVSVNSDLPAICEAEAANRVGEREDVEPAHRPALIENQPR